MAETLGAQVVVLDGARVLLVRRRDLPVWVPGGAVEPGETSASAAVREAREEAGLEVRIVATVGEYLRLHTRRGIPDRTRVFVGEVIGGTLARTGSETSDARFVPVAGLPRTLVPWDRGRIADAVAGARDRSVEQRSGIAERTVVLIARLGERLAGRAWGPR